MKGGWESPCACRQWVLHRGIGEAAKGAKVCLPINYLLSISLAKMKTPHFRMGHASSWPQMLAGYNHLDMETTAYRRTLPLFGLPQLDKDGGDAFDLSSHQQNIFEGDEVKGRKVWGLSSFAAAAERNEADLRVPDCAVRSIAQSQRARCKRKPDRIECMDRNNISHLPTRAFASW
jgi:hypothetical protein